MKPLLVAVVKRSPSALSQYTTATASPIQSPSRTACFRSGMRRTSRSSPMGRAARVKRRLSMAPTPMPTWRVAFMTTKLPPQMRVASSRPSTASRCLPFVGSMVKRASLSAKDGGDTEGELRLVGVVQEEDHVLVVGPGLGRGRQHHPQVLLAGGRLARTFDRDERIGALAVQYAEGLALDLLEEDGTLQRLAGGLHPGHPLSGGNHGGLQLPLDVEGDD